MNLLKNCKITLVQAALADGQSDPDSTAVDMKGFDGVMFVGIVGTITGSGTVELHAQQSSDNAVADAYSDLSGVTVTASTSTESDKALVLDVFRPQKRYVRVAMTRATANSIVGGVVAIQYAAALAPTTQDASVIASVFAHAPSE